jgi:uncharacterized protein
MRSVFIGSNGIRAGWRLALFLVMVAAMAAVAHFGVQAILHLHPRRGLHPLAPWFGLAADLPLFLFMIIAALVMSRIEHRPFAAYGLPLRRAFRGNFWLGALVGFVSLTCILGVIALFHGVHFSVTKASPGTICAAGVLYALSFLATAFTEEFLFRGYPQATLAQGIGFWPAGVLLSLVFAGAHAPNGGESVFGVIQVFVFAMVFLFALAQTGTLWFAVGYHLAWDWGETFFYGVPDSGTLATTSLLHGTLGGPAWLSGGADGPEASLLTTIALLALVPFFSLRASRAPQPVTG